MICVSLNCVVRTDPIETVSASSTYMQTQHTTPHHDTGVHTSSSQMQQELHLNLSSYMRVHVNVSTAAAGASVYE
jgi:hypothetical protein